MRRPRSTLLFLECANVHLFWRAHNKEHYLSSCEVKEMYLRACHEELEKINRDGVKIRILGFCLMNNHVHLVVYYCEGSHHLSNYMRNAHGRFGARFNKRFKRSGKVAEGRPKTPLVQDDDHLMRLHFYVEANPVRAGICKAEHLRFFKYSSYRFFAYGIRDNFTQLLTPPDWYLRLGSTAKDRQRRYRKLFWEYLAQCAINPRVFFRTCRGLF